MEFATRPSLPKRGSTPDTLDPVAASSTPISPDPRTRSRPRLNFSPAGADPEAIDELRRRYIAAGIDPETAQAMAEQQVLDNKQDVLNEMDAPGNARLARQQQAAVANRQRMVDAGYVPTDSPSGAVSYELAPDMVPLSAEEQRAEKRNPFTEPGPNMPDGTRAMRPRQLSTEREANAYNIRTPDGFGKYKPSRRDKAQEDRGYRAVWNDDGTVGYRLSPEGGFDGLPGAPGRAGERKDLEGPILDSKGQPVFELDEQGNRTPVPRFVRKDMPGPLTENNVVYTLSDLNRRRDAATRAEQRLYRMAAQANMSPQEFLAAYPAGFEDLEVTVGADPGKPQMLRAGLGARMAVHGQRQKEEREREETWRAQMMLSGGRPTAASKATVNALRTLPEDQRASTMRYMLPGGQLSATVDANNAALAGRMAQSAMTAFLTNNPASGQLNPLQQQQLNQMQSQLPAAEQIPVHKDKPGVHPSELKYADDYVGDLYSSGGGLMGISSEFSMAEQQATITHLVTDMGYKPAKAQKIVDEIARRRNAGSYLGSPTRDTAPGAAPGKAAPPPAAPPGRDPRAWGGGA